VILLALLLVALICIVIGIVTATAPWFIASLVASAIAGFLLWRERNVVGAPGARAGASAPATAPDISAGAADVAGAATADQVWVVDGRPRYHASGCVIIAGQPAEQVPLSQAQQDGFIACSLCTPSAPVV